MIQQSSLDQQHFNQVRNTPWLQAAVFQFTSSSLFTQQRLQSVVAQLLEISKAF